MPIVSENPIEADKRLVEQCEKHIVFDLADLAKRMDPDPLGQPEHLSVQTGEQTRDDERGSVDVDNAFLVELLASSVSEMGAQKLVRKFLSRRPSNRADIATVQDLIKKLRNQKRLVETRDVAEAFLKLVPGRPAVRNFLHALDSLGDDWAIQEVIQRPDIAKIMNDAPEPFFRGVKINAIARVRIKFECSHLKKLPPRGVSNDARQRVGYFVHNSLPFASGGYAIRTHGVAQAISAAGHNGTVFARSGFPNDLRSVEESAASQLDMTPQEIEGISYEFSESPRKNRFIYKYIEEATNVYEAHIRSHSLDLVHAASNYLVALPAALAARRQGIPFVYEVRGFWDLTRASRNPNYLEQPEARRNNLLEQLCLGLAQTVLTLNDKMASRLADKHVDRKSIFVLPNCVNLEHFEPRPKNPALMSQLGIAESDIVIGYVGSFVSYEGIDILIQAFAQARKEISSIKLLLVGDDRPLQISYKHSVGTGIQDVVTEMGVANDVIFTGRVPFSEVADYYSLIDVCPFPRTRHEVCQLVSPLKPLEAMSMRKCVLVSDVGGMDDVVEHSVTGLRFESENVEALAATLIRVTRDHELRASIAASGRNWVEANRTWISMGTRIDETYSHAVTNVQETWSKRNRSLTAALSAF